MGVIVDEILKICNQCEHKSNNWFCLISKKNILEERKNINGKCPLNLWDNSTNRFLNEKKIFKLEKNNIWLIRDNTPVEEIIKIISNTKPDIKRIHVLENVKEAFRRLMREKISSILKEEKKEKSPKRGIVTCGGGAKYYPSLYVNIRIIRCLNNQIPIEVFYYNNEMDPYMVRLLEEVENVKCINASKIPDKRRKTGGWELKPFALRHCSFSEAIFLDADCTPMVDPSFLFEEKEYLEKGAIFWPDYKAGKLERGVWETVGLEYRDERAFETGQMVINLERCWKELELTQYFCDYSDYYFQHYYGDKEAFHLAWRAFNTEYAMPPDFPGWENDSIILQYDLRRNPMFIHRTAAKFRMDLGHKIASEMPYEETTIEILKELQTRWNGMVWLNSNKNDEEIEIEKRLTNQKILIENKKESFSLNLLNGNICSNNQWRIKNWSIFKEGEEIILSLILGNNEPLITKFNNGIFLNEDVKIITYQKVL
ncbi:MAG: hypothetical protein SNJ71_01890 [Bacteroidales bacterium]